jgi:hypothetical protein
MENKQNVSVLTMCTKLSQREIAPTVIGSMHPDIVWNEAESNSPADRVAIHILVQILK